MFSSIQFHCYRTQHSRNTIQYGGVLPVGGALGDGLHARLHHVEGVHHQRRGRARPAPGQERPPGR